MSPIVERQVKITLGEKDVKRIICEYINENKSKFNVKEVFVADDISINIIDSFSTTTGEPEFESITALSKTKDKL